MLMILRLNWMMYTKTAALATVGLLLATQLEGLSKLVVLLAVATATFWTATSLAASWWIYDRAHIYDLHWLNHSPGTWLNLHNGLDEITHPLKTRYAGCSGQTLDIFDPNEMTEPSILEARRQLHQPAERQTNWRYLPAANQTYDTIFLAFTAHEFRRAEARDRLFIESQRVLRDDGRLILVEHLRDTNNFAVFGPGALHFFSKQEWLRSTAPAGLILINDQPITPFVHVLEFGKRCAS